MIKRVFLFALTNIAVLVMFSIILAVLGAMGMPVDPQTAVGSLILAAVFGFGGALVSLALSKTMALRSVGAQVITTPRNETEAWLLATVDRLAREWRFKTPDVAIYDSPEPNAFATGARKNASLVAVSTGLLYAMTRDEVEGVLGHEISHIGNGDMVTMTLIQGVVNTFVVFLSRIVAQMVATDERGETSGVMFLISNIVLQMVFGLLASVVVMWFSRHREYRADEGSARHVGAPKMIAALKRLQSMQNGNNSLPEGLSAMGISGAKDALMSTHPTLENRIAHLQGYRL